ncbi:PREDICTED: pulmonary surfactant-associated protein D-like, partial [Nanorana parkeri]|uniref:pulmonary surfactant-associated protein D-like n=1 Tax=Nanorana parkeri TaxID=125878 RepID=UPI000854F55C
LPGVAGPPGSKGERGPPGPKGDKGDSVAAALEDLKKQISTLERRMRDLQSLVEKQRKAFAFSKETSRSGNKIYVSNGVEATYPEAKVSCASAGGQLATPRTSEENQAIFSISRNLKKHAFMGITDMQTEGVFRYPSGETITYSNWGPSEPNNTNGVEDCVEIRETGKWNDENCSSKRFYICEF